MTPHLIFLYPSRAIGGAQLLFLRLAGELARRRDVRVSVVDYPEGFLASRIPAGSGVELIAYRDAPVSLAPHSMLVAPLSLAADLSMFVALPTDGDVGVLLWMVHPENARHVLYGMGRGRVTGGTTAREALRALADAGAIAVMDSATRGALEREIGDVPRLRYLPIPHGVPAASSAPTRRARVPGHLGIGWLGRLSHDKIHSVYRIAEEIAASPRRNSIIFHVIGDGDRASDVRRHLDRLGINWRLCGVLTDEDLSRYVDEHVDLGIAMGTSCLELAARGVPALLIDYSFEPFPPDTRYNWLHESDCFTLGDAVGAGPARRHTFEDVLDQWYADQGLGDRSARYATEFHAIDRVADELLRCVSESHRFEGAQLRTHIRGLARGTYGAFLAAAWQAYRTLRAIIARAPQPRRSRGL